MPTARSDFGIAVFNNLLVAAGGFDGTNVLGDTELYDIGANSWQVVDPLIAARRGLQLLVVGTELLAMGGVGGAGEYRNLTEKLELQEVAVKRAAAVAELWMALWLPTNFTMPEPVANFIALVNGLDIFVVGGESETDLPREVKVRRYFTCAILIPPSLTTCSSTYLDSANVDQQVDV